MALSSDEIIKREIIETFGDHIGNLHLRIFPESSNDDQVLFTDGGLTFLKMVFIMVLVMPVGLLYKMVILFRL